MSLSTRFSGSELLHGQSALAGNTINSRNGWSSLVNSLIYIKRINISFYLYFDTESFFVDNSVSSKPQCLQ